MKRLCSAAFAAGLLAATSAAAQDATPECYDAIVFASVIRHQPTTFPDGDEGEIIIAWPWFVDMQVRRVVEGSVSRGPLTVLAVLHNDFRRDRTRRWWLRRNTLGGFNLLRFNDEAPLAKCAADSEPARPYYRPAPGQTLEDVRREAETADGVYQP